MQSNGSRLIQPNAMNVETTFAPGPLAQPCAVTVQSAGGVKVLAVGGLTKVEALAGQIAGFVLALHGDANVAVIAESAVNISEAILAECERRRSPPSEDQP